MLASLALVAAGLVLLVLGAEGLVRGASRLAARIGVTPLVIGLTVVAYGTSAPELAVSVRAGLAGQPDIAIGNVVGSNIFNVLLILGGCALVAPLRVDAKLVRIDVPLLIVVSGLVWAASADGRLAPWEAALLAAGAVAYTVWSVRASRAESRAVSDQFATEYSAERLEVRRRRPWVDVLWVAAGLGVLVFGARLLVDGAVDVAHRLGIDDQVVGLTIVAAGTSLPELATSLVATLRGERDIAIGNIVGSNLFNLLAILGVAGVVTPGGLAVSADMVGFDFAVMTAVAVACLPVFFTGWTIARWEGALFVAYYVAYATLLVLEATRHWAHPLLATALLYFAVPLTALTLGVVTVRALKARGSGREGEGGASRGAARPST